MSVSAATKKAGAAKYYSAWSTAKKSKNQIASAKFLQIYKKNSLRMSANSVIIYVVKRN